MVIEDYDTDMLAAESGEAFEDIKVIEEPQAVSTDGKTEVEEIFAPKLGLIWENGVLRDVNAVDLRAEFVSKNKNRKEKKNKNQDEAKFHYTFAVDAEHVGMNPVLADRL